MPRLARPFFIPEARRLLRATVHVVVSEPSRTGRRGPEPWDTWQRQSPPEQGGRVWSCGTRGNAGALPSRDAGSRAAGHVAMPDPSRAGRRGPEPSRSGRQAPELRNMWQHRSPPKQGRGVRSRGACGNAGALPIREAGSGATGHVATPEPSQAGTRDTEPRGTWQRRSPPEQRGVWSRGTRGNARSLSSREAGSGAAGHVAAPEPSRAGRWGPESRGTWQHRNPPEQGGRVRSRRTCGCAGALSSREAGSGAVVHVAVRLAPCLGVKPVCGGTRSAWYRRHGFTTSSTSPF
jgi:hypothetical protein